MAQNTIDIIIKVRDAASKPLDEAGNKTQKFSGKVKDLSKRLTEFNRVLFSTSAFVNLFKRSFVGLFDLMDKAADIKRIEDQFERNFGSSGNLFKQISDFTDNSIDKIEAMKQGIALRSLGIIKDTTKLAETFAKAGTAAKLAGLDSSEGIKQYSEFLKTGNVSNLQFLNLIAKSNPQLQTQMSILSKYMGVLAPYARTQYALAAGTKLLNQLTKDQLKGNRDLADIMKDVKQNFLLLKTEIGSFIGKALGPVFEHAQRFAVTLKDLIKRLQVNGKELITFAKNIILIGGALTGLLATVGTFRLVLMALSSLGLGGIPLIVTTITGLVTAFTDVDSVMGSFIDTAKKFGSILLGAGQIITSFLLNSENFQNGVGKMDKKLYDFLKSNGLLDLTVGISRAGSAIIRFVVDAGNQLIKWIDFITTPIQKLAKIFSDFFGNDGGPWSRGVIENTNAVRETLVKLTAGLGLLVGGKMILSKIPGIGKIFGGKTPKGTASDPLYVKTTGGLLGGVAESVLGKGKGGLFGGLLGKAGKIGKGLGWLSMGLAATDSISTLLSDKSATQKAGDIAGSLGPTALGALIGSVVPGVGTAIGAGIGGAAGALGLDEQFRKFAIMISDAITGSSEKISQNSKTSSLIPSLPESEEAKIDLITSRLTELQGQKRTDFQKAVQDALSSQSENGGTITRDEWIRIFTAGLDNSQKLDKIANYRGPYSPQQYSQMSRGGNY